MSQPSPCSTAEQEAHEESVKESKEEEILETVGGDEREKPELNAEETETKSESKGFEKDKPNCDKTVSNLNQESEEPVQIDEDLSDTERNSESADLSFSEGPNIGNTDDYYASGGSGSEREIAALEAENKTKSVKSKEKSVKSKAKRSQSQRLMTDFVKQKPNKDNNKSKKSHSISDSGSETDPVDSGDSEEKHTSVAAKTTKKKKMGNIIHKGFRFNTRQVVRSRNVREKSSDSDDDFARPSLYKRWSDKDTEQYRQGYPGKREDPKATANKDFYFNERPSLPEGDNIENIHKKWKGDYHLLERHHGYIQWLFPIRESGMNWHAQELQLHETKAINMNEMAHSRVLESYKLMLDFYGIELTDPKTGELKRSENWKSQFNHLNRSMHNYLRITRILKSLGEFEYEHLKEPFVKFMMTEALKKKTLPNVASSCMNYWVGTIKDDEQRKNLRDYATELGYEERKY